LYVLNLQLAHGLAPPGLDANALSINRRSGSAGNQRCLSGQAKAKQIKVHVTKALKAA